MIGVQVRAWLMGHTPLEPALLEGAGFESMVYERVASAAGGDEAAYLDVLRRSPGEVERLIAGVAVAETWLFRYPRSFDLLVEVVCADRRALLDVTNRIRGLPGVVSTESFLYLELWKQLYDWGAGGHGANGDPG